MSERGTQLRGTAERQVSELIDLFSARGEPALSLPCSGREKLGDGTVAAIALHIADNYNRIAGFLQANDHTPRVRTGTEHGPHRIPVFMRARGRADRQHDPQSAHDGDYGAESVSLQGLLERLSAGRAALSILGDLTDEQLDAVPPAGDMKFCDGQRPLQQIVTNLLNHQSHQVGAVKAALA